MVVAAVIMAGGRGERFWPSSRDDFPKQFLALDGNESLLQRTLGRVEELCPPHNTWVVTREDYADLVSEHLPTIPQSQQLLEPIGRDTAPCIALTALHISHALDDDAVMVVLPADHLVLQEERFRATLQDAIALAGESDLIVTLGIRPTRPETGYGYIQMGADLGRHGAHRVVAFAEKPPLARALTYLAGGKHLWNSGIFICKVSTMKAALWRHLPDLMAALSQVEPDIGTERERGTLAHIFPDLPKISIDYGVMEKAENTAVIPADFGWDDLGSWTAVERVMPKDEQGNIISGRVLAVDTETSILRTNDDSDRLLVAFGLSDVVVVDTADVVLVAAKSRVADLKTVVRRLEAEGLTQHLRSPNALPLFERSLR